MTTDALRFGPEAMPTYDGPGETQEFDPDCCSVLVCRQRDYNRANLLALKRMTQAYAALVLAREATRRLWRCDSSGHTVECPNPACTFGRDMSKGYDAVIEGFCQTITEYVRLLSVPSLDATPQWEDFHDIEQAEMGLDLPDGEAGGHGVLMQMLRMESVEYDPIEFVRWFRPPVGPDDRPS